MIIHDSTGINGGMDLREGLDASGRKAKYKFLNQQPLNSGELFVYIFAFQIEYRGKVFTNLLTSTVPMLMDTGATGLAIWAVTLAGLLAGGALLVYNTSALAQ
ncbi:hypothetical protein CUMW_118800 [Citrus unshiu]|nr:hypothetical protein CUMW_118800 [Citrus unshiu]